MNVECGQIWADINLAAASGGLLLRLLSGLLLPHGAGYDALKKYTAGSHPAKTGRTASHCGRWGSAQLAAVGEESEGCRRQTPFQLQMLLRKRPLHLAFVALPAAIRAAAAKRYPHVHQLVHIWHLHDAPNFSDCTFGLHV